MKISIIIPTFQESQIIVQTILKIDSFLSKYSIDAEIIIVDDNSPDQTSTIAKQAKTQASLIIISHLGKRSLSNSALQGFTAASTDIIILMDADLSHPLDAIPQMIALLENEADIVVGSRYIKGGNSSEWNIFRRLLSSFARITTYGITTLTDPTSGFVAFKKNILNGCVLKPIGWKIVLELVVKSNAKVKEIPITFIERKEGKSKLSVLIHLQFIIHLIQLHYYVWSRRLVKLIKGQ